MPKNKKHKKLHHDFLHKHEHEHDHDLTCDHDHDHEMIDHAVLEQLLDASGHQMLLALELTKLVVGANSDKGFTEDHIFSIFKRASKVIAESSPFREFCEKI